MLPRFQLLNLLALLLSRRIGRGQKGSAAGAGQAAASSPHAALEPHKRKRVHNLGAGLVVVILYTCTTRV